MTQQNLLDFCYPGFYEIYCHTTQCSYFGESQNVLYRLGRHFNDLQQNIHEIQELQNDWLRYGRQAFTFRIVESGDKWKKKGTRIQREKQLIESCTNRLYNTVSKIPSTFRKQVIIDGVTYSSAAEAARKLGRSPSAMYRFLKKRTETKIVSASKPVSIDGREFESVTKALSELNLSKSTLYRRLKSSKYPTWFYIQKTRSNDYPERE